MISKAQIKFINSLGQKKYRKQHQLFIAETHKIISELFKSHYKIHSIFATKEWVHENKTLLERISPSETTTISPRELQKISQLNTPNQVLALVHVPPTKNKGISDITLMLDAIRDPGNIGTILRIADWFGIGQVTCSEDCVDVYNPKAVQSSMGSIFRVNVHYSNLVDTIKGNPHVNFYASALEGKPLRKTIWKMPVGIIIGNESHGISRGIMELVGTKTTIEKNGQAESLNAATATSIILYQALANIQD